MPVYVWVDERRREREGEIKGERERKTKKR
jgi:hypothetical protein